MTTSLVTEATLDTLLALQFTVAWAGEGQCDPPRLKWWRTDLIDETGAADLFERLLPRTHVWASLEMARLAACQMDAKARQTMANPDRIRTLYFWGFGVDEQLSDRLLHHKLAAKDPQEVLPALADLSHFDRASLEQALRGLAPASNFELTPSGRQLKGNLPDDLKAAASHLAAALVPFPHAYPTPFYRLP